MFAKCKLIFPGNITYLGTEEGFSDFIDQLWEKEWVVYCKPPFDGPEKVLDYLGRYTHRVAIANHRIVKVENGLVTFRYRDRTDGDKCKLMTIAVEEFIRRFLLHVIPESYVRIRHFGFLANRCKKRLLPRCRELLGLCPDPPEVPSETMQERMLRLTGVDITECPCCKRGHMIRVAQLPMLLPTVWTDLQVLPEIMDTS
jgi:hypothetical protein